MSAQHERLRLSEMLARRRRRRACIAVAAIALLASGAALTPPASAAEVAPTPYKVLPLRVPGVSGAVVTPAGVNGAGMVVGKAETPTAPKQYRMIVWDAQGRVLFRSDAYVDDPTAQPYEARAALGGLALGESGVVAAAIHGHLHRWTAATGLQPLTHTGVVTDLVEVNASGQILAQTDAGPRLWAAGDAAPITAAGLDGVTARDLDDAGRVAFEEGYTTVGVWSPAFGAKRATASEIYSPRLDDQGHLIAVTSTLLNPGDEEWNWTFGQKVVVMNDRAETVTSWNEAERSTRSMDTEILDARAGRVLTMRGDGWTLWSMATKQVVSRGFEGWPHLDAAGRVTMGSGGFSPVAGDEVLSTPAFTVATPASAADGGWMAGWPTANGKRGAASLGRPQTMQGAASAPSLDLTVTPGAAAAPTAPTLTVGAGSVALLRLRVPAKQGVTLRSAVLRLHLTADAPAATTSGGYDVRLVTGPWSARTTSAPVAGKLLAVVAAGAPDADVTVRLNPGDLAPGTPLNLLVSPHVSGAPATPFFSAQAPAASARPRLVLSYS